MFAHDGSSPVLANALQGALTHAWGRDGARLLLGLVESERGSSCERVVAVRSQPSASSGREVIAYVAAMARLCVWLAGWLDCHVSPGLALAQWTGPVTGLPSQAPGAKVRGRRGMSGVEGCLLRTV
jgi:hypothetical protein